jgi:hypothetical protein
MTRFFMSLALALLLSPVSAFAQATAPPPEATNEFSDSFIEPWVGIHFAGDLTSALSTANTHQPMAYGVTLGFWQRGFIGGEVEFGYAKNYFGDSSSSLLGGNNLMTFTGSMILGPWIKFSDNQAVRPYFVVGGGLARSRIEDFAKFGQTDQNRGVIDFGGGVNAYFTKNIGIRGDVRIMRDVGSKDSSSTGWGITDVTYKRIHVGVLLAF